jgi:hypothetical protein
MLNDTLSKIAKLTLPNTKPSLSQFFFPPQDLGFIVNAIGTMLNAVLGISDKVIPNLYFDQLYGFWQSDFFWWSDWFRFELV